jgi:hypothetical protein
MADELDPKLLGLFGRAQESLPETEFLARVVERIERRQRRAFFERAALILAGVALLALAAPSILKVTADAMSFVTERDSDYASLLVTPAGWSFSLLVGAFMLYRSLRR